MDSQQGTKVKKNIEIKYVVENLLESMIDAICIANEFEESELHGNDLLPKTLSLLLDAIIQSGQISFNGEFAKDSIAKETESSAEISFATQFDELNGNSLDFISENIEEKKINKEFMQDESVLPKLDNQDSIPVYRPSSMVQEVGDSFVVLEIAKERELPVKMNSNAQQSGEGHQIIPKNAEKELERQGSNQQEEPMAVSDKKFEEVPNEDCMGDFDNANAEKETDLKYLRYDHEDEEYNNKLVAEQLRYQIRNRYGRKAVIIEDDEEEEEKTQKSSTCCECCTIC